MKRGNILIENVIFIILNVVFLIILILFLLKQGNGAIVLEKSYAKQIALLIDSSKPNMLLKINLEEGFKLSKKNNIPFGEVVKINGNLVRIKLSDKSGYSYSFFNDVDVGAYPDVEEGIYILKINNYNKN